MEEMMLYRNMKHQQLFDEMRGLMETGCGTSYISAVSGLVDVAESHGFSGNVWHCFLAHVIANNENAFSISCEIKGMPQGSIRHFARHDFAIFRRLFAFDLKQLDREHGTDAFSVLSDYAESGSRHKILGRSISGKLAEFAKTLSSQKDDDAFMDAVAEFYKNYGVGKYGLYKAFECVPSSDGVNILPIRKTEDVRLSDLIGYGPQKKKLMDNTEAFIRGLTANNCLLYGDAGTGKSTSIKAILNEYCSRGLRMIEMYKHQMRMLPDVIARINNRNYKFIIYMDDLSFEDFEVEYKYLKAVIEGGLGRRPENLLIYATSNRRHLISETMADKDDWDVKLHSSDTVQEKLSLSFRFGINIYYGRPERKEFRDIVEGLAARNGIQMPKDRLFEMADRWELSHGGMSGRSAQQFITFLGGCHSEKEGGG